MFAAALVRFRASMSKANGGKANQARGSSGSRMLLARARVESFLRRDLWQDDPPERAASRSRLLRWLRIFVLAVRSLQQNDSFLHAAALTYITVLSLVPLLALACSVAKGFGAYDKLVADVIRPALDHAFGAATVTPPLVEDTAAAVAPPAPAQAPSDVRGVIEQVLEFVSNTDFSSLGAFGLIALMLAAIKLLTSIEQSFNQIWGAERQRTFVRRITDYLAMVIVTPIIVLTAVGATGAAQSHKFTLFLVEDMHLGIVMHLLVKLLPLLMLWLGFGFLYLCMPNTRVALVSALVGGIVGGTLWQVFQVLHVKFQVGVANYNTIYAGFAAFPIFLVWMYTSWLMVLLGCTMAWAHQAEPDLKMTLRWASTAIQDREVIAVRAAVAVAEAFAAGEKPQTAAMIGARIGVAPGAVAQVFPPLVERGIFARVEGRDEGVVPARDLALIDLADVLDAARGARDVAAEPADAVAGAMERLRADLQQSKHNLTLRQIVEQLQRGPSA